MPVALCYVGGLYAAWRFAPPQDVRVYRLFVIYALGMVATIFLPATVYLYYFAAFSAPAALIALPFIDRRGPGGIVPGFVLLVAICLLLNPASRYRDSLAQRAEAMALAAVIAPHVDGERRCMWIHDGPTVLYRLTGSCVPTRFVYPDHLNNALETPALGVDQTAEAARILASKPPVLVTGDPHVTPQNEEVEALLRGTLARDYAEGGSARIGGRTITAWMRRDEAGDTMPATAAN